MDATDIVWFLQTGFLPDGDAVEGLMAEVIEAGYGHLTREDLDAIATWLGTLAPVHNRLEAPGDLRD